MLGEDWEPFGRLLEKYRDAHGKRFALLSAEGASVPVALEELLARGSYPYVLEATEKVHFR
ncbi:hypothetical protein ACFPPD_16350 [Cohnella suwonensis]|uniref:Uncharacterized protein n=1 Tax=Cohnella suwonensis TaxID=696072 RepID=A0ABW0LWM3_9BACL